jgi:hypothetical protein
MNFIGRSSKNIQISNFTKIRQVGADLLHADRHDEANSDFSQFCEKRLKVLIWKPSAMRPLATQ